ARDTALSARLHFTVEKIIFFYPKFCLLKKGIKVPKGYRVDMMRIMFWMVVCSVVMGSFVKEGRVKATTEVSVSESDNTEPFSLICRIYNVAKNPPTNHIDLEEPLRIVQEVDALNTSLVEPKLHNETEQMVNSLEAVKPTVTWEAALSQLSLNQITQKAHKSLEEIEKIKSSESLEKAKADFSQVIFGEDGNESDLCHATVKDVGNRATACGSLGQETKGKSAGKNLVVDFFCLCAMRTTSSEGAKQACGFYVGRIDKHYGWSEKGPWGSSTMWASIKGGCGKHMQQHPKSTAEARHILDQFLKHLKTEGVYRQIECEPWCNKGNNAKVKGSHRKAGMLGTGITVSAGSDFKCDGKEVGREGKKSKNVNPGGVCVYYGPDKWEENIEWVRHFQTALNTLESVNNKTATIQRAIEKLQMLLNRAEEIYETTQVITEIQKPEGLAAFQNASGDLTVHNATRTRSYSHRPNPYFIPAWALFLI
ncbi:Variant surface glycoprotein, partial [Trypanosoma congolense IL3000]